MNADELIAIGRRLARPVVRLVATGDGEPIGAWCADQEDGPLARLRVDVSKHPDPACRRPGALELRADGEDAEARLVRHRRVGADETALRGLAAIDPPCIDLLFAIGGDDVRRWLAASEWKPEWGFHPRFAGADIVREYDAWWWRETAWRAPDVYGQLGGWPITWPEEPASAQLRRALALRTYRGAEPWFEVFWQRPQYAVRARIT